MFIPCPTSLPWYPGDEREARWWRLLAAATATCAASEQGTWRPCEEEQSPGQGPGMAIMQEDILKFGVRTRKRNKSIKESAKLVM